VQYGTKDRQSARSHVHERTYLGEETARPLIEYLNSLPPGGDAVEGLLERIVFIDEDPGTKVERLQDVLCLVQGAYRGALPTLTFRPVLSLSFDPTAGRKRFTFHWEPVNEADARQAEAFLAIFELASQGLISRVRKCARPECNRWFWAKFEHQRFDLKSCQEQTYHLAPEWKAKRALYMRKARLREKEREQKFQQLHKRRG
jgi:hypothetical protein